MTADQTIAITVDAHTVELKQRTPKRRASLTSRYDIDGIVQCVNAHEELVAALDGVLLSVWSTPESGVNSYNACITIPQMDAIRAALARARGEAPIAGQS